MAAVARLTLRLVLAPAALAAAGVYKGWATDPLAAVGMGWCLFVLCVVGVWGKIRLERARRRLRSVHRRVGTSTS